MENTAAKSIKMIDEAVRFNMHRMFKNKALVTDKKALEQMISQAKANQTICRKEFSQTI